MKTPALSMDRIDAIKGLVNLAYDHPFMQDELLNLVRKVAGPEPEHLPIARVSEPTFSEIRMAKLGQKIPAIKAYRERTGFGLKEAKDAIEQACVSLGLYAHQEPTQVA